MQALAALVEELACRGDALVGGSVENTDLVDTVTGGRLRDRT